MSAESQEPKKLAGFVLALLGFVTVGATSPFGFVLCWEWLLDPTRRPHLRKYDAVGLVLAVPGIACWALVGYNLSWMYGDGTYKLFLICWLAFAAWTLFRWRRVFRLPSR